MFLSNRAIYGRMGGGKVKNMNDDNDGDEDYIESGTEIPRRLTDNASEVSGITASTTTTGGGTTIPNTNAANGRRDSFWGIRFTSSSKINKVDSISQKLNEASINTGSSSQQAPSIPSASFSVPAATMKKNQSFELPEDYMENLTDYALFDSNDADAITPRQSMSGRASMSGRGSVSSKSARQTTSEPGVMMSSTYFGTNDTEKEFLSDPSRFFREDQDRSVLFTRTFYHHMNNLEAFLIK